ncbi:MAG: amino acid aminotransferase [Planctomycetota bacterium]
MLQQLTPAPPDAILGLVEAFNRDPRAEKVNLTVGTYRDADGKTPVLACVKEAEAALLEEEQTKAYLPIPGHPTYGEEIRRLLLGESEEAVATMQTPGGTGALRVVADFLAEFRPGSAMWMPHPTWPNHPQVFSRTGLTCESYPYLDESQTQLDRQGFLDALAALPPEQFVLVHGCCHNPSGVDLTKEDWVAAAELLARGRHLPVVDIAYQGYGQGIEEDAAGIRILAEKVEELFVCNSFSKIFSLYRERVGGLTFMAKDPSVVETVTSRLKRCVRTHYSNPPAHGGAVVTKILTTPALRADWLEDLSAMRDRIRAARVSLTQALRRSTGTDRFDILEQHQGMFSLMGLSQDQVERLREEHAIYLVANSRLNVAAITDANVDVVAQAIADVL